MILEKRELRATYVLAKIWWTRGWRETSLGLLWGKLSPGGSCCGRGRLRRREELASPVRRPDGADSSLLQHEQPYAR